MVTRGALTDAMAIGYRPVCTSKPGLWPCYPIMPRFGLMGLGRVNPVIPRYGFAGLGQDSTDASSTDTGGGGFLAGGGSGMDWTILIIGGLIGTYALYSMFHQTKQTALKASAKLGQRRKRKAQRLREKAKKLEGGRGKAEGFLFGIA